MKSRTLVTMGLGLLLLLAGCQRAAVDPAKHQTSEPPRLGSSYELYVATDLHYLNPALHDNGQAFQDYVKNGDSKLLPYSDELLNAWVRQVIEAKPAAVILSGDLTNNGEKASHEELAKKLAAITDAGIRVFVIPGNHDISNPWARSFQDDRQLKTDYISPEDFTSIYGAYGYKQASEQAPDSLSYLAKVSDQLWLLMLDSNRYANNLKYGYPETGGELSEATLTWMKTQGEAAKKAGARVVAVMHHNLFDHSDFRSEDFTASNADKIRKVLKEADIHLALSGHIHIQDIRSEENVTDIATSAMAVYPHQFGILQYTASPATVDYRTESVNVESWARSVSSRDPNLLGFQAYSRGFFHQNSYDKALHSLESSGYSEAERKSMASVMADLNPFYFGGMTDRIDTGALDAKGIELWKNDDTSFLGTYILSMMQNAKDNTRVHVPLTSGE
ncbi:metallophosphoesterase [Gorillibacterium sp. CAU 1737]|uniref:metallophosphoesterase n=1 Tax=Gorillibacterium sp. CAU 1737 TaxID=3140362 RepID=UPI0032606247